VRLNQIYEEYKDRIQFLCVYIEEAHTTDEWQHFRNVEAEILYEKARTEDERAKVAQVCMLKLNIKMPMLLDSTTNEVNEKYAALPERFYVIDENGNITYGSARGPQGFIVDDW
jgi:hypothetical protein